MNKQRMFLHKYLWKKGYKIWQLAAAHLVDGISRRKALWCESDNNNNNDYYLKYRKNPFSMVKR